MSDFPIHASFNLIVIFVTFSRLIFAVERFSLGVRNPTALLAGASVSI